MSQKEKVFSRKQLLVIFKIAFLEAMALSLIIPTISSTGEIPSTNSCTAINNLCQNITFDSLTSANTTSTVTSLSSTISMKSINETIVVMTNEGTMNNVTSVTDNSNDVFTRKLIQCNPSPVGSCNSNLFASGVTVEIWTGIASAQTEIITVTWTVNDSLSFIAASYQNVGGTGSIGGTAEPDGSLANGISVQISPSQSGSFVIATAGTFNVGPDPCPGLLPEPNVIQRANICTGPNIPSIERHQDFEDNNTALSNLITFIFQKKAIASVNDWAIGAIELIPVDKEPKQMTINNAVGSGNSAINKILKGSSSVINCTGIHTTGGLTLTHNSTILIDGMFQAQGNQTGWSMTVNLELGTSVPSAVFGNGDCGISVAPGGTASANMDFPITPNVPWSVTFSRFYLNGIAGITYYAWFTIVQRTQAGHISLTVLGGASTFASQIEILETT